MGYCFVEMADEATAERCLRKINGKSLPGASPVRLGASVRFVAVSMYSSHAHDLVRTKAMVNPNQHALVPDLTREVVWVWLGA